LVILKNILRSILGKKNIVLLKVYFFRVFRLLFETKNQPNNSILQTYSDLHNHVFFGYYDVTPFSTDEKYILATKVPCGKHTKPSNTPLRIGYYSVLDNSNKFNEISITETWCWQQGCRLQWFPKVRNTILFNVLRNGQYGSLVQNIKTKKILSSYSLPIYAISKDGEWGLSLNFSRLQRLRPGYGYSNIPDDTKSELCPTYDGIYRINLSTGEKKLLFSLKSISSLFPKETMTEAEHYFNHLSFNPSCNRFMFFHLWVKDGSRFSRLFTADISGNNVFILNNEGPVSHYSWKSEKELLVYGFHQEGGFQYYLYKDLTNEKTVIGKDHFVEDGHPSFLKNSQFIITDTYPDKYGEQHLLLFNLQSKSLQKINQFFSPPRFRGEIRCDLHPRISPSGYLTCLDTAQSNNREMIVISLADFLYDD
jgi:hypothetical protein